MKTKHILSNLTRGAGAGVLALTLTAVINAPATLWGASPPELLEKAIYTEETKGDVDSAMTLYKQVVGESKAGEASAAQAQYRLGVCYYKKKDYTEASAAFEKLVHDFPEQGELVKAARRYLDGTLLFIPAPWADGEQMQFDLKLATGFKAGTATYAVDAGETNGQKIWRFSSHLYVGMEQLSRVEAEADTLKPLHSRWKHTLLGDADTTYSPGLAVVKFAGQSEVKKVELEGRVYDNEEAVQAMRRLPLATNYSATLRIFTSLGGGNIIPIKFAVTGIEKVTVPAGTFDCYKIELSLVKQTFWVSADLHRYVVKFEGGGVIAELVQVGTRNPNAPVEYHDAGFSISAPPDWLFFQASSRQVNKKTVVNVIDPDGIASTSVAVQPLATLEAEPKKSLQALADWIINDRKNELGLTVRTNGWQERTLGGQPALSFICDYGEGKDSKVAYGVCSLGTASAVSISALVPAKDFDALKPKIDALADSYRAN